MRGQIAPLNIVTRKQVTPESFSNFMRGGSSPLGSSSLSSASNKIVNFSRATTTPVTPDFSSILGSISTSINNNYQSTVQNIYKTVNQTLGNAVNSFRKEYQEIIKSKEDSTPSNVLKNFQILYKNTIDFVTFFGDAKNNTKITNALKSLRGVFQGSFETASKIRQTIGKIVGQLTNLPTASGRGGSLDIEVKIPGEKLRQSGGDSVRSLARSASGGLGIGMGMGIAASGMMNAKKFQEQKLMKGQPETRNEQIDMFESFIDNMKGVIESFNSTITQFVNFIKEKFGGVRPTSSSSSGTTTPPPTETPSSGNLISGPAPPEVNALMSSISKVEGELESVNTIGRLPGLSKMTIDEAIQKVEKLKSQGKTSGAMGNMQQMSQFLRERAIAAGLDPKTDLFNEENQYKINRKYLSTLFSGGEQQIVDLIKSGKIEEVIAKIRGAWPSVPGGSQQQLDTSSFYKNFESYLKYFRGTQSLPQSLKPIVPSTSPVSSTQNPYLNRILQNAGISSFISPKKGSTITPPPISPVPGMSPIPNNLIMVQPPPPLTIPIPTPEPTSSRLQNDKPPISQGPYFGGIPSNLPNCPNGLLAPCFLGVPAQ